MQSSAVVHAHLQCRTASCRSLTVDLVRPSMGGNTRMLLDITREEVDTRSHGIIHLEHHVEMQDIELEERVKMITNLEQQLPQL
jgi:hypothetical protein